MQIAPSIGEHLGLRRVAAQFVCWLTVVFVLFGPYLGSILRNHTALWFMWQPGDWLVLLACLGALAAVPVLAGEIIRRWCGSFLLKLFDHAFVIALGAGLLTNLWFHTSRLNGYRISQYGMEIQTAWLVMFLVVGYSMASGRSRIVLRARQLCQILSPAVLIVAYQLVAMPTLAEPMDPIVPTTRTTAMPVSREADSHPVYLLILDEWSYTRTYRDGKLRAEFRNLADLSRQATTYHAAHSPGSDTAKSVPAICRQTSDLPEVRGFQAGFTSNAQWIPASQYPTIFTRAGCADYRKIMVHWGFALSLWLDGELDITRAYSCYPRTDGPVGQSLLHLYNAAFYWTDPWTALAYEKLQTRVKSADRLALYEKMHRDLLTILRDESARTFSIVHYPIPHYPYILNSDGSYRGPDAKGWDKGDVEGYRRNLACVDRLVGEIVDTLKSAGRFDECLLILTSDHSWRNDPDVAQRTDEILTHVPLIVKFPGQKQPSRVDADFRTCHLGELIGWGLRGESVPRQVVQIQDSSAIASKARIAHK